MLVDTDLPDQFAQPALVGTAADDHEYCAVDAAPNLRQRTDQHVLSLAGHQPRQTQHGGSVAEPVSGTQLGARGRIRPEHLGVHTGRQVLESGVRPERGCETSTRVAADEGDGVGLVADPA